MAIETRGHSNTLVVLPSAVPVEQITDAVIDRNNLDWICNRFPVSVDDVFECIDVMACLLYTSPSPRDLSTYRMPSSA